MFQSLKDKGVGQHEERSFIRPVGFSQGAQLLPILSLSLDSLGNK